MGEYANIACYTKDNEIMATRVPYMLAIEFVSNKYSNHWTFIDRIFNDFDEELYLFDDEEDLSNESLNIPTFLFLEDVNKKKEPSWHILDEEGEFIPYHKGMLN
jgi:hypothetical protein